jgi:hypothetical protein
MFKSVEDLRGYLAGAQKNLSDKTILPFVEQAAIKHIIPFIGNSFYQQTLEAYQPAASLDALDEATRTLVKLIQRSLAYYTLLEAMPFVTVVVGDGGLAETSTQNSMPIRQWNYHKLEASCAENGDVYLDFLLAYLEEHLDDYPDWRESGHFTHSRQLVINHTAELSRLVPINNSRRAFLTLRPYIARAEELYLLPVLGPELFEALKNHILDVESASDGQETPEEPATDHQPKAGIGWATGPDLDLLRERCRKVVAQYAVVEALPEVAVQLTGAGIRVLSDNDGIKQRFAAGERELSARMVKAMKLGEHYLEQLKIFLDTHVEMYPEYQQSPAFQKKQGKRKSYQVKDNAGKPSFRV